MAVSERFAIWISVVDSEYRPIKEAEVVAYGKEKQHIKLRRDDERWIGEGLPDSQILISVSAKGYESESHAVSLHERVTQVVIGLRKPGQLSYNYGDNKLAFSPVQDALLVRIRGTGVAERFPAFAKEKKLAWKPVLPNSKHADDDLFVKISGDINNSKEEIRQFSSNRYAAEFFRSIEHGERPPLGLNNEIVVRFQDDVKRIEAERIAGSVGLHILRELKHAGNAFLLASKGEPSYDILKAVEILSRNQNVIYAEPNLTYALEPDVYTPNDPLWGQLAHLQLSDVDDAWDLLDNVDVNLRGGSPNITIGVIDLDGVAQNHPELTANLTDGTSKLVASMNFAATPVVAQTVAGLGGDHGTQCAGSATAAFDNNRGIAGVAPNCHLIGARIGGSTNAVLMADIYMWVGGFLNGSTTSGFPAAPPARAADVISSSWGATGLALSNTIRDCFDFITTYGRSGKGCVLCFSLGNSGYGDYTNPSGGRFRAWPTYEKTLGVGASINMNPTNPVANSSHADQNGNTTNIATTVDTRALYSPYGATALRKPDLVAPSHTAYGPGLIDPITSLVRIGTGAIDGCPGSAVCNDYAATFGGTSHATPSVAGAVALILSARPSLNWVQVREILRQTCVRIDAGQTNTIGQWQDLDGDMLIDYSRWYGAGRIDVDAAVATALDPSIPLADVYVRENLADTGAVPSSGGWWASPDIWVRQDASTPIPALAWTDSAPHENARRGQDNAVFCRVRNRGTAAAPVVYVRAMITHWAGLEFLYPADFQPSNNVGAPVPNPLVPGTYLIGEARIDNLAAGADQIVKFTWPQALIPPETVTVSGASVRWHPCLLVEASPHDGPNPVTGLSVPVQGNNNIAQRNIEIINPGDASSDAFVAMIAGTRDRVGVATLVIDASRLRGFSAIKLHMADPEIMKFLWSGAKLADHVQTRMSSKGDDECCVITLEQKTRVRMACGSRDVIIDLAAGSRILSDCDESGLFSVSLVNHSGVSAVEIQGLKGQVELPLRLEGGRYVPLLVAVDGKPVGDLRVTQRRGDGQLSAGYGIRWSDR